MLRNEDSTISAMSMTLGANLEPIPGYRLIERLGRGGFGEVWKAEAPGGLLKAIKFVTGDLDSTDDAGLAEQELKSLARVKTIRHPFILSLERFDVIEGQLLIVMELADRNLWDRFRECRTQGLTGIPKDELLGYMREAAEALDLMNGQYNLQHLDIKPQNLFLVYNHVKVADFGLVKDFEGKRGTITGGVTPVYAAPETFDGWASRNSDQYSLAIVYQELLTGQRPFNGTLARQLVLQHLQAPPDVAPLPVCDRPPVQRALAKKPDDRFPTCAAFVEALYKTVAPPPSASMAAPSTSVNEDTSILNGPLAANGSPNGVIKVRAAATQMRPRSEQKPIYDHQPAATHETDESGVLAPTLILGLGGVGNAVLRLFRRAMVEKFGCPSLPNVRLLATDTDPNALRMLTQESEITLAPDELFLANLGRPSRYLRGDQVAGIDTWLGNNTLYRLPKKPCAAELRAFGRLALLDHAASLARRVRAELEACRSLESLAEADRITQLGIRGPMPHVYIVAGLAGGTGSGMFLDAAYLVRSILRNLGETAPQVTGLLMLPPCDRSVGTTSLANTHAALKELQHFSSTSTMFTAKFDPKQPAESDPNPPFHSVMLLPLGDSRNEQAAQAALGQASGWLIRETLSTIGRVAEHHRAAYPSAGSDVLSVKTAATFHFAWPREQAARLAARQLGRELLTRWTDKDAHHCRPIVTAWIEEKWVDLGLEPEKLADKLHQRITEGLGRAATEQVERLIAPLVEGGTASVGMDALYDLLDRICHIMGSPDPSYTKVKDGRVTPLFAKARPELSHECDKQLADLAIQAIERPGMRVVGAEEVIRQMGEKAQKALTSYESLAESLATEVNETSRKLMQMIVGLDRQAPTGKKRDAAIHEMLALFRDYPKKQYQSMLAGGLRDVYRGIVGSVPDYLQEMNLSRERPAEAIRELDRRMLDELNLDSALGPGRCLLPGGDATAAAFAQRSVAELTSEECIEADTLVQKLVDERFEGFLNFCLGSGSKPEHLVDALEKAGTQFFMSRLASANPADLLVNNNLVDELKRAVRQCRPPLVSDKIDDDSLVTIVCGPPSEAGAEIVAAVKAAVHGATVASCTSETDVAIYRELRHLPLTDVPHMGPVAVEAYKKAIADSQSKPHSRIDIVWQAQK